MAYVKRTIELWYETNHLAFPSVEAEMAFQQALGRMIMYNTGGTEQDTTVVASIVAESVRDNQGNVVGKTISQVVCNYKSHNFVMAMVARDGGLRYSYHS